MKIKIILLSFLALPVLLCASCASYKTALLDRQYEGPVPDGMYTVIKYGGNHNEDFATFALLVPENSPYKFEIFRPDFEYSVITGVHANAAKRIARDFVMKQPEFASLVSRAIVAPDGREIGYEIKPLYRTALFGTEEAFVVVYLLTEGNIIDVRVVLDDAVIRYFMGDTGD